MYIDRRQGRHSICPHSQQSFNDRLNELISQKELKALGRLWT